MVWDLDRWCGYPNTIQISELLGYFIKEKEKEEICPDLVEWNYIGLRENIFLGKFAFSNSLNSVYSKHL